MSTKRKTTEAFINDAISVHGNKFDYSKVEYVNNKTKVCIICPIHGEFWQTPQEHLIGCGGCPTCAKLIRINKKTYSKENFINKAKIIHGDKFDYSKVEYVNNRTKVCIICPQHGEFWQTPNSHLQGEGCPNCRKSKKMAQETFIKKAKKVHGDKYDYSKVNYVNSQTKVCIICPQHGEFWQTPNSHLSGKGCKECANEYKKRNKYTTRDIIKKFKKIHGDYFDYSKFVYNGIMEKSLIICPNHGEFVMNAHDHLKGHGCPMCNQSFLEKEIKDVLDKNKIQFEEQKTFDWLKYKGKQYLDFYLPKYNIAIECQGIQHFKPIPFFSKSYKTAELGFIEIIAKDDNKKSLCEKNGVEIFYFSHKDIFIENKSNIKKIFDKTNDIIKEILKHEQKSS